MEENKPRLYALRTTGGQEKIIIKLLENKINKKSGGIKSVLLVDNLKGYMVIESLDVSSVFEAIQGIRNIRGQLRGELSFNDIEKYLIPNNFRMVGINMVNNNIFKGPLFGADAYYFNKNYYEV